MSLNFCSDTWHLFRSPLLNAYRYRASILLMISLGSRLGADPGVSKKGESPSGRWMIDKLEGIMEEARLEFHGWKWCIGFVDSWSSSICVFKCCDSKIILCVKLDRVFNYYWFDFKNYRESNYKWIYLIGRRNKIKYSHIPCFELFRNKIKNISIQWSETPWSAWWNISPCLPPGIRVSHAHTCEGTPATK